jgi:hypothetical protein
MSKIVYHIDFDFTKCGFDFTDVNIRPVTVLEESYGYITAINHKGDKCMYGVNDVKATEAEAVACAVAQLRESQAQYIRECKLKVAYAESLINKLNKEL